MITSQQPPISICPPYLMAEIQKITHRRYTSPSYGHPFISSRPSILTSPSNGSPAVEFPRLLLPRSHFLCCKIVAVSIGDGGSGGFEFKLVGPTSPVSVARARSIWTRFLSFERASLGFILMQQLGFETASFQNPRLGFHSLCEMFFWEMRELDWSEKRSFKNFWFGV